MSSFAVFEVPGCGRVIADLDRDDLTPVIQFEDGQQCFGLPRTAEEVAILAYDNIAKANFEHEALHMFLADRFGFTAESVLYRAAAGCKFTNPKCLNDAFREERIVLGVQMAINEAEGKLTGFGQHVAGAAREFARAELERWYDANLDQVVHAFRHQLYLSGRPSPVWAGSPAGEFGDVFHPEFGSKN